jgi:hypothetical protein
LISFINISSHEQFKKLVGNAQKLQLKKRQAIASQGKRLIKAGGGRKKNIKVEEEIILTLYYQDLRKDTIYSA